MARIPGCAVPNAILVQHPFRWMLQDSTLFDQFNGFTRIGNTRFRGELSVIVIFFAGPIVGTVDSSKNLSCARAVILIKSE